MTYRKFREIISNQMLSPNPVQRHYPGDHKMRAVTKVVRIQKSVSAGEVTEKYFSIAKNKQQICKAITILCVHAEISDFVKKSLKCVWCSLDTSFVCRVFLDSNKKPISLH